MYEIFCIHFNLDKVSSPVYSVNVKYWFQAINFIINVFLQDIRNTVGNIPMEWYDGFDHIGYNVRGEKIIKPPTRDELDEFLSKVDNPDYW